MNQPKWILEKLEWTYSFTHIVNLNSVNIKNALITDNFFSWKKHTIQSLLKDIIVSSKDLNTFFTQNPNIQLTFSFESGFGWKDWGKIQNTNIGILLQDWYDYSKPIFDEFKNDWENKQVEEYLDFSNWIIYWAIGWLAVWWISDWLWLNKNNLVEWITRFISWNWDTIGWILQRIKNKLKGWKDNNQLNSFAIWWIAWMLVWPLLQVFSIWGWNNPLMKAIYTNAYSNSDNLCAWVWSLVSYIKNKWRNEWIKEFWAQPFQRANLIIIFFTFILNLLFLIYYEKNLDSHVKTAIHWTILNLDSILASLYMKNYASRKYKKFIKKISARKNTNK